MAVTSNSTGAYTAGSAVLTILRRFRDKGLQVPITADVLLRAGVSDSLVPRTLQSLQILELIDETGQPTETLQKIRSVPEADYKATLADWIRSVYAEVFAFADPQTDDAVRVRDAFRTFTPHGQQDRMVALFLTLCAEAGLVDSAKKSEVKPSARKAVTGSAGRGFGVKAKPKAGRDSGPPPPPPSNPGHGLPPAITGMLQSIPTSGGWSQQSRDRFLTVFGSVLDFAIPIRPDPVLDASGEGDDE